MKAELLYPKGMERPDIRDLECFIAVAEELNFSRAAERLHLSQPPLSRRIRALEEKVGVVLLKRDTQTVSLTPAGTLFLEDARQLLRQTDRAVASARAAEAGAEERLDVGFVGATLEDRMTRVLRRFRREHPRRQLRLHEMTVPDLLDALREGNIDGAFIGTAPARLPRGFRLVPWRKEPAWIAVPREHRLARRGSVHLRELSGESWVVLAQEAAPAYHRQFVRWCEGEGFSPRVVAEPHRVAALLAMVAVGEGISLIPDATRQGARNSPEVRFLRILSPAAVLVHVFACRKGDAAPALAELIALLEREEGK